MLDLKKASSRQLRNLICRYSPKANSAKRRPIAHTRFILRFGASDNVTLQLLRQKPGRKPCTQRCLYSGDWQVTAPTKRVHSAKPVTGDQWLRTTHNLGPITAQPLEHVAQSDSSTWVNTLKSWLDTIGQEWIISTSLPKIYPSMSGGEKCLSVGLWFSYETLQLFTERSWQER